MCVALLQIVVVCVLSRKKKYIYIYIYIWKIQVPHKVIWKIQVPHKVRNFAWRVAKDILPTKANLVHRHAIANDLCEECGMHAESLLHLSLECPKAREAWSLTKFSHLLSSMTFRSFIDFLWYIVMKAKWPDSF